MKSMSKKGRKYIEENEWTTIHMDTKNDARSKKWKKQRKKYGFDERDTWNMDSIMIDLLYERLCMYLDIEWVNLEFHQIEIDGVKGTQKYWIGYMLELIIYIVEQDSFYEHKEKEELWYIWSKVQDYMWW